LSEANACIDGFVGKASFREFSSTFRTSESAAIRMGPYARHDGCTAERGMAISQRSQAEPQRPVVALLETRMSSELARLVEKHGGRPLCVPAVLEAPQTETAAIQGLLDELAGGGRDVVIFMTGVAVSLLFELAEQLGRRAELVTSLKRVTTVCRGPKPTAALRGFGVPPTLSAREPFTAAELIDALADIEVSGKHLLLFNYGERSETLSETLLARQADLHEFWLYRWLMPVDTTALERLVHRIVDRDVDALAVTCQIQFRHLYRVAERLDLADEMIRALKSSVVVAAVGPTCRAILEVYGVEPQVMPDHPKMGPLVMALMRHLHSRAGRETMTLRGSATDLDHPTESAPRVTRIQPKNP
jgi:uroporphyrinogen-III synthase